MADEAGMKTKFIVVNALSCLLLACSGENGNNKEPSNANAMVATEFLKLGSLDLDTRSDNGISTSALASFEILAQPMPARAVELLNIVNRVPNEAQCRTFSIDDAPGVFDLTAEQAQAYAELLEMETGSESEYGVSAGSPLIISTPSGDWPELVMDGTGGYHTGAEEYKPNAIAEGSSLTIPGAQFPAMNVDKLPTVDAIRGLETSASPIHTLNSGAMVSWQTTESTYSDYVSISISVGESTFNGDNDTSRTKFVTKSVLQCVAPDTGQFEVPSELSELLAAGDYSVGVVEMKREAFGMEQQGDALLLMFAKSQATIDN